MYKFKKIGYLIDSFLYVSETGDFMYRKFGLIAITLVIITSMTGFAFLQESSGNQAHSAAEFIQTNTQPQYRICPVNGYVAVYSYPQNVLYCKTDIPMQSLRQNDQEKIIAGLYLYTPEELTTFLEDFGS